MPGGRPSVFTPALIQKVAQCFFDGLTDEETGLLCDIDVKTIQRARAGKICLAIKKAESRRLQIYIEKIRDGTSRDWVRIAWFLERRYPERFARPEIQLSFSNNYNHNNLTINLSAPEAKSIEAQAKPVREAISSMFKAYRPGEIGNNEAEDANEAKDADTP